MLQSGIYQKQLMNPCGRSFSMHVYDKCQDTTALLDGCCSCVLKRFSYAVKGCLTEKERNAFQALYTDLPGVLLESLSGMDSLLEWRSQIGTGFASGPVRSDRSLSKRSKKQNPGGIRFTEHGEQLLNKIEKPLARSLWNQLLSFDDSFMSNDQLRLDFFVCVTRQIWSSPTKQTVLSGFLKRLGIGESGAVSIDRMFPYFVYHQIAINSIVMSTSSQYHLSFLRIPKGAEYRFIVTDHPAIDLSEEQKLPGTTDANRFLWVISPSLAVIISDKTAGKTRFINEGEVTAYNTLLFEKATRYIVSDRNGDFLPICH